MSSRLRAILALIGVLAIAAVVAPIATGNSTNVGPRGAREANRHIGEVSLGNIVPPSAPPLAVVSTDPAVSGQWAPEIPWPEVALHLLLLDTGKVLSWERSNLVDVWDPATGSFTRLPPPTTDLFCAGEGVLADGRAITIGGNPVGTTDINFFDPKTQTWKKGPDMSEGRWYPTGTLLPDGRLLAISGAQTCLTCLAQIPEVYDAVANTWTQLTGASANVPMYPFMFVLPDGRLVHAGGSEVATSTEILDVNAQTWTSVDPRILDGGSATMYAPGKIMKAGSSSDNGGVGFSANTTYVIDMNQPNPTWRQTASMAYARTFLNLTLLPDGNVLATGGDAKKDGTDSATAVLPAEIWSPVTETWTTISSMAVARMYHSTALLLPDGRVLVSGGGSIGGAHDYLSSQIFSPPYLFKGARPTITSSPSTPVVYGDSFFVQTPDAASISSISLIRTGAVTHAFDQNTRRMNLTFQQAPGGLTVQAPVNANLAPPGDYMLFIVNSAGVPSVAPFLRIAPSASSDTQPPSRPGTLTASSAGGTVNLNWGASTDNIGVDHYDVYRSTTSGFTPGPANRAGQPATASYADPGLADGTYYYRVIAFDAAGNPSAASNEAIAIVGSGGGALSFGNTSSAGVNDSGDVSYLNGSPATLTSAGTLTSLSVYIGATAANAHVRLGIYSTDGSGNPANLLAETAPGTAALGWDTLPVPQISLAAGTYWIMAQTDNAATVYRFASAGGSSALGWSHQIYGNFPATVSAFGKQSGSSFAMYGVVSTAPVATPTATGTPPATNTPAPTPTFTRTATATNTPLPTSTRTVGPSPTPSLTPTVTNTPVPPTATLTPTNTAIPTATNTPAPPTATPTPGATATFGNTSSAGINDSGDVNYLNGSPATLATAGTLSSLSVYVGATAPNAHVRAGIYSTNGSGNPGTLLAETAPGTAVVGWNTLAAPQIPLAAGTYWIMAQTDNAATVYRYIDGQGGSTSVGWSNQPYGSFPATIPVFAKQTGSSFAMYGIVSTGPAPTATATNTPAPTATVTRTPTATNTALPSPTATATGTATATAIPTNTPLPTSTPTIGPSATPTLTPVPPTATATPTNTAVPTATNTPVPPTATFTPTATPTPGASATFGRTSTAGINDSSDDGYFNGSRATLASGGTLSSLSVYVGATAGSGHLRVALYTNNTSGKPGTLIAQSAEVVAIAGWNTVPVPTTALAAGTYWILAQTDSAATVYRYASGQPATEMLVWSKRAYGPFPAAAGTFLTQTGSVFSMYGTVTTP